MGVSLAMQVCFTSSLCWELSSCRITLFILPSHKARPPGSLMSEQWVCVCTVWVLTLVKSNWKFIHKPCDSFLQTYVIVGGGLQNPSACSGPCQPLQGWLTHALCSLCASHSGHLSVCMYSFHSLGPCTCCSCVWNSPTSLLYIDNSYSSISPENLL